MWYLFLLVGWFGYAGDFGVADANRQDAEKAIVYDLFRLRNEHKADSAVLYFADRVQVYMKYLRNVSRQQVAASDRTFWKAHPNNKFEITAPVEVYRKDGFVQAIIFGKEYLDGTSFVRERIEIRFNSQRKIYYYRGFNIR